MNHTQGPWTLKHVSGHNFAVQRFEIRGVFNGKAGVFPVFHKDTTAIDGTTFCASPQDARLIASAPELLEALQAAEDVLATELTDAAPTLIKVRAAIKKARGD